MEINSIRLKLNNGKSFMYNFKNDHLYNKSYIKYKLNKNS